MDEEAIAAQAEDFEAAETLRYPSLTNRLISRDRNNHPMVQISRIDGHTLVFWGSVKVNLKFEIGEFGLSMRVDGCGHARPRTRRGRSRDRGGQGGARK